MWLLQPDVTFGGDSSRGCGVAEIQSRMEFRSRYGICDVFFSIRNASPLHSKTKRNRNYRFNFIKTKFARSLLPNETNNFDYDAVVIKKLSIHQIAKQTISCAVAIRHCLQSMRFFSSFSSHPTERFGWGRSYPNRRYSPMDYPTEAMTTEIVGCHFFVV